MAMVVSALLSVAVLGSVAWADDTTHEVGSEVPPEILALPGLSVSYLKRSGKPELDLWIRMAADARLVEVMTARVDAMYALPRPLPVVVGRCNRINAYYAPARPRVVLCGELIDYFSGVFVKTTGVAEPNVVTRKKTLAATQFTMFHEMGHALVAELNLPATGREEDVADQFAVYLSAEADSPILANGLKASMEWFDYEAKVKGGRLSFWDEHGLDRQRFYNIACWTYGSNPERYEDIGAVVPKSRRVRCVKEWERLKYAFDTLLEPHLRPPEHRRARLDALLGKRPQGGEAFKRRAETCKVAFTNVIGLKTSAFAKHLETVPPEEQEAAAEAYKEGLITWTKRVALDCATLPWSDAKIACMSEAKSLFDVNQCPRQ